MDIKKHIDDNSKTIAVKKIHKWSVNTKTDC